MQAGSRFSLLGRVERALKSLATRGSYHPERHYMRGSGPKSAGKACRSGPADAKGKAAQ